MTNDQYGNYETPSSRPPEPPYRVEPQQGAPRLSANQVEPKNYSNGESFHNAQNMPMDADLSGLDKTGDAHGSTSYGNSWEHESANYTSGFRSGDTQSMPYGSAGRRGQQARSYAAQPVGASSATVKQSGGAGKTFLFGFLGALLACAIAFGAFIAWNQTNKTAAAVSTTVGTTDSSVINAVEEGQTLAEAVAAKALPSVVAVYNYQKASTGGFYGRGSNAAADTDGLEPTGMGSGVVISSDGYIVTNYHVVEGGEKLTVKVGQDERDATYVGGDSSSDVAVIKVNDTTGLEPADIGDSDSLVIGEWVMTVGAPLGLEQSVATGVISATNRSTIMSDSQSNDLQSYYYGTQTPMYTYYPNMIQTDAVINPGNSGGALVDADGKLIGINAMISSYSGDYAGVGFAIPVNYAISIANDVIAGKQPTHAMLGVSISSVNANNAQRYGLSTTSGAYVASISEGTGAADSDLQVGDIITQVDDTKVASTTDVTLEVREHNPGDTVNVTVNRNGQTLEIPVVLSSDENQQSAGGADGTGQNQEQGSPNGRGQGRGNGYGSNGYDTEQLEELLRMLGM